MREVFKRVGINDVRLPQNSNRVCEIITLAEAHKRAAAGTKVFIKPIQIKLFTGLILDGFGYTSLKGLPDDTQVMAYEPFSGSILSEWRIYVHNHAMVDSRNYSGYFTVSPDYGYVEKVIKENKNKNFPIAYTIDIAVLTTGASNEFRYAQQKPEDNEFRYADIADAPESNVVVEFNDMWAIGNYGMPNDLYLKALKARYLEIMKL